MFSGPVKKAALRCLGRIYRKRPFTSSKPLTMFLAKASINPTALVNNAMLSRPNRAKVSSTLLDVAGSTDNTTNCWSSWILIQEGFTRAMALISSSASAGTWLKPASLRRLKRTALLCASSNVKMTRMANPFCYC